MTGFADDGHRQAALRGDGRDDAQCLTFRLEHGALLDMGLDIGSCLAGPVEAPS